MDNDVLRVKRLGNHHNIEVRDTVEVAMLLQLGVFLNNDDTIVEDPLVNSLLD